MKLFERATEKAMEWVKDMMTFLDTEDPERALHALRAGLHALRDRLTVEEAAQLSAQMPMLIKGLFFENWHPAGKPLRIRTQHEFLALVVENYGPHSDDYADDIVRSVFRVLQKHVSQGELTNIAMSLPAPILALVGGTMKPSIDPGRGRHVDFTFATLSGDHAQLDARFAAVLAGARCGDVATMRSEWQRFDRELTSHMDLEEAELLPAFERQYPEQARSLREEHVRIRAGLTEMGVDLDLHCLRADRVEAFIELLRAHARSEEHLLYPWAGRVEP